MDLTAQERAKRAQQQEEEVVEQRRLLAAVVTARSQRGTSPSEVSASPRRPVPVGGDPDDGDDGDNDDDDDKEPCEQCRLDWLITDTARRRRTPPELLEAGPSGLLRKRRRVMDSDEEEEHEREKEMEEDGEGEEEEMVEKEMAPTEVQSEKGKERAVE
ncbi:hypothetical protein F5051DRAFT_447641 [Lentinula edodes]|nr:hypothetical protein F5051DRAFT_447641 [Lentinula edodes]